MRRSLQTFTATALALACGHAMAHPSMFTGSHKFTVYQNTAAGPNQAADRTTNNGTRGYVDGARIGHGCALTASEPGATVNGAGFEKPIAYSSWIFPAGEGVVYRRDASGNIRQRRVNGQLVDWVLDDGRAPWSTSSTGSDPTIGYRPAVARITNMANDGKDATKQVDASGNVTNTEAYIGTATTLASELEFKDASGNWVPMTSLRGFITTLGNAGYYRTTSANTKIDGFVNKNPRIDASGNYTGVDYASASLPGKFATAVHIGGGGSGAAGSKALANVRFKANSCARRLVIRPGAVDVCSYDATGTNFNSTLPGEEHINTWMGGRTAKWKVGDAGQQNNWSASFTLLNNAAGNTAGGFTGCADANNGDYDLVVMPTHYELDTFLPTGLVKGTANPGTL
jgi:hypothetical protein